MKAKKSSFPHNAISSQSGFTLLEVLIASVLGLVVLGAFFKLYLLDVKVSLEAKQALAREDELRFVHLTLQRAVQGAGFRGWCGGKEGLIDRALLPKVNHFPAPLIAYTRADLKKADAYMKDGVSRPLSDVLFVEAMDNDAEPLRVFPQNGDEDLNLSNMKNIEKGDFMMLADCQQVSIFPVLSKRRGRVQHMDENLGIYGFPEVPTAPALVGHFVQKAYYLGHIKEGEKEGGKQAIMVKEFKSNYYQKEPPGAEALMVGVNSFEMTFAERTLNGVAWRKAKSVSSWHQVLGVKFEILLPPIIPGKPEEKVEYIFAKRNGIAAPRLP